MEQSFWDGLRGLPRAAGAAANRDQDPNEYSEIEDLEAWQNNCFLKTTPGRR